MGGGIKEWGLIKGWGLRGVGFKGVGLSGWG